jgi:hypothetical protein
MLVFMLVLVLMLLIDSLFVLTLHQRMPDGSTKTGRLNLADLAGMSLVNEGTAHAQAHPHAHTFARIARIGEGLQDGRQGQHAGGGQEHQQVARGAG